MSDWVTLLISGGVSIVLSIITAWITSKLAFGKVVKEKVYEKREELYSELFNMLFMLKRSPYLVYDDQKYVKPLTDLRTKLMLFASQDVLNGFETIYGKVLETHHKGCEFSDEIERTKEARIEYGDATELEINQEEDDYFETHVIDSAWLSEQINVIMAKMRKDIGTKDCRLLS